MSSSYNSSSVPPSIYPPFENTHVLLNSASFLLHLIDPVRIYHSSRVASSEAYTSSSSHANDTHSSEKLKRRLIDALAFICATEREGDSPTAVCIEEPTLRDDNIDMGDRCERERGGYTLRIAKSGWVGEEVLHGVRDIMKSLEAFAYGCELLNPIPLPLPIPFSHSYHLIPPPPPTNPPPPPKIREKRIFRLPHGQSRI